VPRSDNTIINTVYFTHGLEEIFKQNMKEDPSLRYICVMYCKNIVVQKIINY